MARRREDVFTIVEDLRVLHVTVAQAGWHFELREDVDRLSKVIVGGAIVTKPLFELAHMNVSFSQDDAFTGSLS